MNDTIPETAIPQEVTLLDYWNVLWKRRRLLSGLFTVAVTAALIISLLLPKIYESTATLLPQLESNEMGGLGALLSASGAGSAAQSLGISLPGAPATPVDLFVAMLKSRIMADAAIKQFNLMALYETKTLEDARRHLQEDTRISVTKEKVIKVTVEGTSAQLAADLANFYVSQLDHLNRNLNVSKAGQNRRFIEQRLTETKVGLVKAEEDLRDFQMKNKTVAVEAQSKAMIEAAAHLQAQIAAQEVQLQVMSTYLSTDNPQLMPLRSSLQELRKQLYMMESGKGGKGMLPGDRLHPAMITVPLLALDYGRLMRELKVQETLYTLLTSQYEQAKLVEARDTPTVQVLDQAVPAEKKSKPSIRLNMMIAGFLSLFIGMFLAFFLEYLERIRMRQA
jgi:tyrosine-protein kinase Etk/Wzc